jgi:aspartate-semialdehyde dehydrogenase
MSRSLRVAVVGATGVAGQQALVSLDRHPWFQVTVLAASPRSAGKTYIKAISDQSSGHIRWACSEPIPDWSKDMIVQDAATMKTDGIDVIFAATDGDSARELEARYAETTPVISTTSAFRYDVDVPIFIPGVNMDHVALLPIQKKNRGWKGFVTPIPNCTTTGLAVALAPLYREFGVTGVSMTSLQALSGAGRSPGVLGMDALDNVIPYIPKEEEKIERETQKILGELSGDTIVNADFAVSATCTRVNVLDGHTEAVTVGLKKKVSIDDVKQAMREFGKELVALNLPSSPKNVITVMEDPFHPQPRIHRDLDGGMTTSVGRIRPDNLLPNGVKFVLLSHNTKMGAAKGATLVAEYLMEKGYIER